MNKQWIIGVVVVLMLLNVASIGFFWFKNGPKNEDHKLHEKLTDFVVHELSLDSSQQIRYQQLLKAHHEEMRAEDKLLRKAKDELFEHLNEEKYDSISVQKAADVVGKEEAKLNLITLHHFLQLKAICNKEQQQKLESLLKDILHRMRNSPPPPRRNDGGPDGNRPPPRPENQGEGNPPPPPPREGEQDGPPPPRQ